MSVVLEVVGGIGFLAGTWIIKKQFTRIVNYIMGRKTSICLDIIFLDTVQPDTRFIQSSDICMVMPCIIDVGYDNYIKLADEEGLAEHILKLLSSEWFHEIVLKDDIVRQIIVRNRDTGEEWYEGRFF